MRPSGGDHVRYWPMGTRADNPLFIWFTRDRGSASWRGAVVDTSRGAHAPFRVRRVGATTRIISDNARRCLPHRRSVVGRKFREKPIGGNTSRETNWRENVAPYSGVPTNGAGARTPYNTNAERTGPRFVYTNETARN